MQAAFVEHDGYQCGYCTPGQICSAVGVLGEIKAGVPSHVSADLDGAPQRSRRTELRERMSGNICRCGAYSNIVEAITRRRGRRGMRAFTYERARSRPRPAAAVARHPGAKFIAGGTNLLDLMKLEIETPAPSDRRQPPGPRQDRGDADGGLRIGALVRNTDLAADARVRRDYGVLGRALLAGASGQLRNKATTAGNLLQRTRCPYFYDTTQPCNKRQPGSRLRGARRLQPQPRRSWGPATHCIATHPSDMAVAMRRSTPRSRRSRADGATRRIPIADFHRLPAATPHVETALEPGELITAVTLPQAARRQYVYRKVRDRASYAFALVSVAAVVQPRAAPDASPSAGWRTSPGASRRPRRGSAQGAPAAVAAVLAGA